MTGVKLSVDEQLAILMRGTRFADETDEWQDRVPGGQCLRDQMRDELRAKLKLGRPLRIYLGVDPTNTDLHVGHFVPLQKLRKFQDLGHQVIFLVGDYTATIGDPSGQTAERKRFTHQQTLELAKSYRKQAFRVLDPERTEVRHNSEWLAKLSFADLVELAAIFPMITNSLIAGTDGRKKSKSYGNTINICDPPFEMYGKAMRISDEYIIEYLEYASSLHGHEIDELLSKLRSGMNPMEIKKALARNLVEQYHGQPAASEAETMFRRIVQLKEAPAEPPEVLVLPHPEATTWVDLCTELGLSKSKSEIRWLALFRSENQTR